MQDRFMPVSSPKRARPKLVKKQEKEFQAQLEQRDKLVNDLASKPSTEGKRASLVELNKRNTALQRASEEVEMLRQTLRLYGAHVMKHQRLMDDCTE
jgi:hypothetical protein